MTHSLILDIAGNHATIRLNRPERHNLLHLEDLAGMEGLLDRIEERIGERGDIRVLVLTGTGEKSFCSGFDLSALDNYDFSDSPFERLCDRLENLEIPTVCALNGGVYGGGTDLALACDLRIGVAGMKSFIPPARIGIHYPVNGLRRAVARLGLGPAKRFFLAGETMMDEELLRLGFVDWLVAREDLATRTDALVAEIAALAPLALSGMKATLNGIANNDLDRERTLAAMARCAQSRDYAEGRAAISEKRKPRFTGD